MKKSIITTAKWIAFILVVMTLWILMIRSVEEKPHRVVINGKEYIRSKEYVGDGHYQVILVPVK